MINLTRDTSFTREQTRPTYITGDENDLLQSKAQLWTPNTIFIEVVTNLSTPPHIKTRRGPETRRRDIYSSPHRFFASSRHLHRNAYAPHYTAFMKIHPYSILPTAYSLLLTAFYRSHL